MASDARVCRPRQGLSVDQLAAQELVKQKEMNASLKEVPQFSKGSSRVQFSKTKLNWLNSIANGILPREFGRNFPVFLGTSAVTQ